MTRKAKRIDRNNPVYEHSVINSSYTVFFVVTAVVWAKIFSTYFPAVLELHAFVLALLFSLMLYVFYYVLDQFENSTTIFNLILAYFSLSALLTVVSAVRGPLADGSIPAIQLSYVNAYVFSNATPVYLTASVFSFYGLITFACAQISTGILEYLYNFLTRFMPKKFKRELADIDKRIDVASIKGSAQIFYQREWKGVVAAIALLTVYTVVYLLYALT